MTIEGLREFGLPVFMTFVLLGAIGIAIRWFAHNIIVPLKDGHLKYLDSCEKNQTAQADALASQAECMETQTQNLEKLTQLNQQQTDAANQQAQGIERICAQNEIVVQLLKQASGDAQHHLDDRRRRT